VQHCCASVLCIISLSQQRAVLCAALLCFRFVQHLPAQDKVVLGAALLWFCYVQHFFSPVQGSAGCSIVVVLFCTAFFQPSLEQCWESAAFVWLCWGKYPLHEALAYAVA